MQVWWHADEAAEVDVSPGPRAISQQVSLESNIQVNLFLPYPYSYKSNRLSSFESENNDQSGRLVMYSIGSDRRENMLSSRSATLSYAWPLSRLVLPYKVLGTAVS